MSAKSQHNNILLAIIGFAAVVVTVGVIGFLSLDKTTRPSKAKWKYPNTAYLANSRGA